MKTDAKPKQDDLCELAAPGEPRPKHNRRHPLHGQGIERRREERDREIAGVVADILSRVGAKGSGV